MKSILLSLVLFMSIMSACYGSNNASDFLRSGVSARAIGMGSAYTAIADHIDGVFFNPAGLSASVKRMELTSSAVNNFDEVNRGNLGYAARLSSYGLSRLTVLGINISNSIVQGIPRVEWQEERPKTIDTFKSVKINETLTFSTALDWYWHLGANIRHYSYEIDHYRAQAWGADVGFIYRVPHYYFGHFLVVGGALHNVLNTPILWSTGHRDSMPMRINLGSSAYGRIFDQTYIVSTEFGFEGINKITVHSGVEYWLLRNTFALRCGSDDGAFTIGVGMKYLDFSLDYAQADYKDLGVIHRITLGYSF